MKRSPRPCESGGLQIVACLIAHINILQAIMDDDFREVLFRLNSSDDDFNYILKAIKTKRKTTMTTLDHFMFD